MMVTLETRYKKNDTIMYKELADGPALIDPYRRTMTSLNDTALEVWRLLDGERSVLDIINAMRDIFETDEGHLKKDVLDFLKEMLKREMIR
ncbi:MAG: PqqD family protein [Candidatus Omnitrophica bacterium]|nr:PqqD family protein [Candidatus Omnitrophota bacterium]